MELLVDVIVMSNHGSRYAVLQLFSMPNDSTLRPVSSYGSHVDH